MGWEKVKLGQFLKNREGRFKPNAPAIQGLKRIEKIDFSGTIHLSEKASNTDMILVKKGDLVISGINVEKGAMNIYHGDEDVVATIHYSSYEFDEKQIDINFLTNFLKSLEFKKVLKEQVPGGIKTEIKPKHILPLLVEIPTDIEEQRNIVKKLNNNNSIIENVSSELTHQLDLIKQLRQAFLREAMQGTLVKSTNTKETGQQLLEKIKAEKAQLIAEKKLKKEKELPPITKDEIPFKIPEHWAWCKIGNITTSIVPNRDKPLTFTGDITWVTQSNFSEKSFKLNYNLNTLGFTKEEIVKYNCRVMPKGSIIMSCVGRFDLVCLIEREIVANQQLHCFVPNGDIVPMYLTYAVKLFSKYVEKDAIHTTIKYLNKTKCESIPIPLPPLHEQEQIVAKLEELMAFCDGLEQSIKESQGYNEMLLQQVLREALQPKTETKIVALESRKLALPLKIILGAHIVDICNTTDFGRVKFQKLLFLTEYHCKIDFDSHYVQKAAGPHDDALIKSIEGEFKRQRFFEVKQENSDLHRVRYTKLPNANQINSMFLEHFSEEAIRVNNLLMKLRTFSWEECEIIATIYAVWNNRLLKGQPITEDLLFEDFMAWSSRKSNFSKDFYKKLFWMREENVIPDGWGNYVDKPDKKIS